MRKGLGKGALLLTVIFLIGAFTVFVNTSFAITLEVTQNVWERDTQEFDFFPITETTLSFDYNFNTFDDPLDDPFFPLGPDSFFCDLTIDSTIYTLLIADSLGNTPDPFFSAPGNVTVTPSTTPGFAYTLTADISSFIGKTGNLYFELTDYGDGYDTTVEIANIAGVTPVPEPSTILLFGIPLLGVLLFKKRF